MDTHLVTKKFSLMGAKVRFGEMSGRQAFRLPGAANAQPFALDVKKDNDRRQHFEFLVHPTAPNLEVTVPDLQIKDRHLTLRVGWKEAGNDHKATFLCGHDERFWFAAAIPEKAHAHTVQAAKQALKPAVVLESLMTHGVKPTRLNDRKNAGYVRQGEWFFVPSPGFEPDVRLILYKEPLRRGRGKPHLAEFLYREGGTAVYTCDQHPNGLTESLFRALIKREPEKRNLPWRSMTSDAVVHVKGRIRHPDHRTVVLPCWHRVAPNTESESQAKSGLAFLD
jgi:hypothetical protein